MTTTFSLADPLPTGTTVLEASAGTGKTHAIAALAVRFVVEGRVRVENLLLVTFSRAATAELRLRVRDRFRRSAAALRAAAASGAVPGDEVDALLCRDAAPNELVERARRLEEAFSRFDRATIATTHEFCHGMLRGLGVLAPQTPQSRLVEDLSGLADEAAADLYLRRWADDPAAPAFRYDDDRRDAEPGAVRIARDAVGTDAALSPDALDGAARERTEFACRVREEVDRRKRERRLYSFDDQLVRLADALADPESGPAARDRLAARFTVVLVDEFQDTDPVQWEVLRSAFVGRSTVVLIGDPKQAIYAFRGADVHTYTAAVEAADLRTTLGVNHRSDAPVVDAVGGLFRGVLLGEGIEAPPVSARHGRRLVAEAGGPWAAGVQLRYVDAEKAMAPWPAEDRIADDLVGVVASLLGPEPPLRHPTGPLVGSDVAVLVRTNRRGEELAGRLVAAGIPATFNGTASVFASPAARDWLTLLRALDQTRRPFLQRALLTDFVGATVRDLAQADEARLGEWSLLLHRWSRVLTRSGVPALLAAIEADARLSVRLLARPGGERRVTDHRHLVELLHAQARLAGAARPRDLAVWLEAASRDAEAGTERTRRLETDDDAVQVMTIHRAKGLQWPVVLLPEAAMEGPRHDDRGGRLVLPVPGGRVLDVGGRRAPGRRERFERWRAEECDESLRSLYVALTRAQSHAIAWWAHHWWVSGSPLHRVLHAAHDADAPERPRIGYDPAHLPDGGTPRLLDWLSGSAIAATPAGGPPASTPPGRRAPELAARAWSRRIDHTWRRTSYSGLTADAHAESALLDDERPEPIEVTGEPAFDRPSPLAALPGGAAFGTLVHEVYESVDATGADWRSALRAGVGAALARLPLDDVDADALAVALEPSFTTPLGPLAPGRTLRGVAPADRLSELDFEFALANPAATLGEVARLLAERLPPDDPLVRYPERLAAPPLADQRLHGFLTGSIDAVLRLDRGSDAERYLVVDYKTNRLSSVGESPDALTVGHYTPRAMAEAMMASHYPLQALLYSVALHRFLRGRLAGYDPERHLGGVLYLFVRGMAGPDTPLVAGHPLGVFSWRPPADLVAAVSALLVGGAS